MGGLRRNRDFALLQAGQLLSSAGSEATTIAYPLLVLATGHSAAQAGLVAFARLLPFGVLGLLAGAAADRLNRRRLMIAADAVCALTIGTLALLIASGDVPVWAIVVVAFVEGTAGVVFYAARAGALRAVVPRAELPGAVGVEEARRSTVRLGGPPAGGALFGLGHSVPFVVDAVSYVASSLSLLAMRTPFQQPRAPATATLRRQIAEGIRFLWDHPFLRTCALLYGLGNFLIPAMLLVIVVLARRDGLSGGETGALIAAFGVGTLAGSLASPLFRSRLSVRAILLLELWAWTASWLVVAWPNVYLLTAAMVPVAIAAPVTDSVVAGVLLSSASARTTVAVLAAVGLALAAWGTLSRALRSAPSLDELRTA